jgi:hypothetical protein
MACGRAMNRRDSMNPVAMNLHRADERPTCRSSFLEEHVREYQA